ncbi:unnamed protein product [Schistosoma margrebowiei]|uniref:Uncharacterized protein n=1 Tax=Schistosoma margrebowiei TaxID=48269 RepID=A0A183N552_9TREM|nr:unnamed protein product [Schistosoma margrebowiei]
MELLSSEHPRSRKRDSDPGPLISWEAVTSGANPCQLETGFQVRACLVMQFDDLRNVCPIHFHRLFLISSSAGSWNAVLALPILAFTSASEPPCSSMMLPRNAVLALPILAFTSASEPPCSSMMLPRVLLIRRIDE